MKEILEKINTFINHVIVKYKDSLDTVIYDSNDIRYFKNDYEKIFEIMPETILGKSGYPDFTIGLDFLLDEYIEYGSSLDGFDIHIDDNFIIERIDKIIVLDDFYIFKVKYQNYIECYIRTHEDINKFESNVVTIDEILNNRKYGSNTEKYKNVFEKWDTRTKYTFEIEMNGLGDSLNYYGIDVYNEHNEKMRLTNKFIDFILGPFADYMWFDENDAGSNMIVRGRIINEDGTWKIYIDDYNLIKYDELSYDTRDITMAIAKKTFIKELESYFPGIELSREEIDKLLTALNNSKTLENI